jgi:hypothetical protein
MYTSDLGLKDCINIKQMQRFSKKSRKSTVGRIWLPWMILAVIWTSISIAHKSKMPKDLDAICTIFADRRDWYEAAKQSEARWGTPTHIQMAIVQQESSFRFNARPPRTKLMGFIPWTRPSNAYGFAQALDGTWLRYKTTTGRINADRDDFEDAIDFVGWYTDLSRKSAGIAKWDPYNQYLAYHEGQNGWRTGSYQQKAWLWNAAKRVDRRAKRWWAELQECEDELNTRWWQFWR